VALSAIRWLKNLQSHRGHRVLLGHAEQSPDADVLIEVGPLDNQPLGLNLEVVSLGLRRRPQTARPRGRSCDHSSVGQDEGYESVVDADISNNGGLDHRAAPSAWTRAHSSSHLWVIVARFSRMILLICFNSFSLYRPGEAISTMGSSQNFAPLLPLPLTWACRRSLARPTRRRRVPR